MSCPSSTKVPSREVGTGSREESAPAYKAVMAALVACCALSGCSDIYFDRRETVVPYAGDAKAINQVTMMVDPWPPYSANRNIAFNGERMQGAVERYRTHNVIRPMNPITSDAGSQPQPPPDYTTEQVKSSTPPGRNGPPPQQGPAPSPWAGPQRSQTQTTGQSQQ
jgi:hypothetical protein